MTFRDLAIAQLVEPAWHAGGQRFRLGSIKTYANYTNYFEQFIMTKERFDKPKYGKHYLSSTTFIAKSHENILLGYIVTAILTDYSRIDLRK